MQVLPIRAATDFFQSTTRSTKTTRETGHSLYGNNAASNTPPEFADRETLWNAAEEIEKQWNSQLARRFVLILPLAAINKELQPMKDIRRWVGKVISPERSEIENKPKQKHSITEKMQYYQDKEKVKTQEMAKTMEQEELS